MSKIYIYVACAIFVALLMHQSTDAHAQTDSMTIFSAPAFWTKLPSADAAYTAWKQGVKLKQQQGTAVMYHDGTLYGYTATQIPIDKDGAVQGKLNENFASRAEMRNIQALGVTAFNAFECKALADFPKLQADIRQCSNVKFSSKFTGIENRQAFSIASLSAESVCSCRKALDMPSQRDNTNTFYAQIAVHELNRLHKEQNTEELLTFFEKNYRRRIFSAPELLTVAATYADKGATSEAITLLDAVTKYFTKSLTSDQYGSCGDVYYKLGQEQAAINSYEQAGRLLNQ
jgi:tetratricopeptide (TPR) repeat protein